MIKDLAKFKMDLTNFYEKVVPANHAQFCKRIAIRLHHDIVVGCPTNSIGTPQDTGWARANWGVFLGREGVPTKPVGKYDPSRSKYVVGASNPIPANAYFNVPAILESVGVAPFIWIYNNVPYIIPLENGHSKQAPSGMVVNALHSLQTFINKEL